HRAEGALDRRAGAGGGGPHLQPRARDQPPHRSRARPSSRRRRPSRMRPCWIAIVLAIGCRVDASSSTPPRASAVARSPVPLGAPTRLVGQTLDEIVPLRGGGGLPLRDLQGQVVLLELGTTAEPTWAQAQARWRALAEAHGGALRVVSVVHDPDLLAAGVVWDRDPLPFIHGWDPQGALALRLGVTHLPTRVILDRTGKVVALLEGADRDADVEAA